MKAVSNRFADFWLLGGASIVLWGHFFIDSVVWKFNQSEVRNGLL